MAGEQGRGAMCAKYLKFGRVRTEVLFLFLAGKRHVVLLVLLGIFFHQLRRLVLLLTPTSAHKSRPHTATPSPPFPAKTAIRARCGRTKRGRCRCGPLPIEISMCCAVQCPSGRPYLAIRRVRLHLVVPARHRSAISGHLANDWVRRDSSAGGGGVFGIVFTQRLVLHSKRRGQVQPQWSRWIGPALRPRRSRHPGRRGDGRWRLLQV